MEQWSILSNIVNYTQYDRHPRNFYNLNIRAVNKEKYKRKSITEKERQMFELDFGDTPEKLRETYLKICEGIQSDLLSTTRFYDKSDLSTAYLGKVGTNGDSKIKAEEISQYQNKGIP